MRPPEWARAVLCEPRTLADLEWKPTGVQSASGQRYVIREGILVLEEVAGSYQNKGADWPPVTRHNQTVRAFEARTTVFNQVAASLRSKTVVDICSGAAMPSCYLAARLGCRVVSVERAFDALKYYGDAFMSYYAVDESLVFRVCADAIALPVRSEAVDAVVGSSWLHHFPDKVTILREVYRVLQPGGLLIAHNEGVRGLLARPTSLEDHYETVDEYRRAGEKAGFTNVSVVGCSRLFGLVGRWLRGSVDLVATRPAE